MSIAFQEIPGTNGFLITPFNIMAGADLNNLTSGANVSSSATALTQASFANAIWCKIIFQSAGAFTPSAGGYLAGWFAFSDDNGSTFEKVVAATDLPRTPDFIIRLFASAYASGDRSPADGLTLVPWNTTKAYIGNRSGVNLSANNHLIKACPVGIQGV